MSFLFNKQTGTADDKSIPYVRGNNVFLGDVPLLEKNAYGRMQPKGKPILHKLFSDFYHCDLEMAARLERNLASMAEAMNNGRPALAAIMLVHMNLPRREMAAKYNPNHAPAHAPNSSGGQFTSGDDDDGVTYDDGVTDDDLKNPQFKGMDRTQIRKQKFIIANLASLAVGAKKLGVPVANLAALSAKESGWGTSDAAIKDNNFFGLHHPASGESSSRPANKNPNVQFAQFANFDASMNSFIEDYGYLVRNTSDPTEFAQALQDSGAFGVDTTNGSQVSNYVPTIVRIAKDIPNVISHIRDYP